MKFTPISLLVGGAGLVAAVPMKLVFVERIGPAPRVGLAGSGAFHGIPESVPVDFKAIQGHDQNAGVTPDMFVPFPSDGDNPFAPTFIEDGPKRHGCVKKLPKNTVLSKMEDLTKYFKKLFGFGPIEEFNLPMADYVPERRPTHPPPIPGARMMAAYAGSEEDHDFHILPFMPGPVRSEGFPPPPPPGPDAYSGPVASPRPDEFRGRHRMWMHRHRPHSFLGRLHKALLTLSPWEGRALSFVVGCGYRRSLEDALCLRRPRLPLLLRPTPPPL